jgi:hypothetical protein
MSDTRFWYFKFDNAPDFTLRMSIVGPKVSCSLRSKGQPNEQERDDWIEAIWDRASHHGVDGQEAEFAVLNDLMEKLDKGFEVECFYDED